MTREEALALLDKHLKTSNLKRHCFAVEAVMRALARRFDKDEEKWGLVGLLHDGDYEETRDTPEFHTIKMVEWLKKEGVTDKEVIGAILSHNFAHTGQNPPKNLLEWSLYCCDELTGFIVACALVRPDASLASVNIEFMEKKWKEKSFAAGVNRQQIQECEGRLKIPLREFMQIALSAMQGISQDLGL